MELVAELITREPLRASCQTLRGAGQDSFGKARIVHERSTATTMRRRLSLCAPLTGSFDGIV
jgi:hypothetical protein